DLTMNTRIETGHPPSPLDYAPPPPRRRWVSPRVLKWLLIGLAVLCTLPYAMKYGGNAWTNYRRASAQAGLAAASPSPDTPVWREGAPDDQSPDVAIRDDHRAIILNPPSAALLEFDRQFFTGFEPTERVLFAGMLDVTG